MNDAAPSTSGRAHAADSAATILASMEANSRFLKAGFALQSQDIQMRLQPSLGPTTLYRCVPVTAYRVNRSGE